MLTTLYKESIADCQIRNKHSAQENPGMLNLRHQSPMGASGLTDDIAFGGGDGALGDPYKPHIHDGTRNWAIEMADLGSGVYLPIDTIASNQAFASSTASKTEGLEYQLPAQSLEGHRYQSEAQLRYSLKVPKKMDRKSSRLSQKDARGSKLADNPSGVSNQEDFSDKLNYKSNHVPTKLDGEDTGAAARRKIPGAWTEDWTSDDENPNNDGDVTKANGGWWASNNLDADSDSWADPVEFTNVNGAELTPRTDEHVADDPPEGTRSAEPTPKVDNCAIEKRTLHSFGQHHTESLPTDFVDWNRDTQSDPSNRLDVGNVPNAAATDHPKPNATPVGFASQDSPARLAATPEQKGKYGNNYKIYVIVNFSCRRPGIQFVFCAYPIPANGRCWGDTSKCGSTRDVRFSSYYAEEYFRHEPRSTGTPSHTRIQKATRLDPSG